MRTDIVRMYKDVHGWVGIISGLALFIAFYAGAITMFEGPLQRWASPPPALTEPTALERTPELIAKVIAAHPQAAESYEVVMAPGPESPGRLRWTIGAEDHEPGTVFHANLSPESELLVSSVGPSPVAEFIDILHQQVGLPFDHEIAMPIMGAIALLYGIALVSGVIVLLPTFLQDLFALRLGKNIKRLWLDVHNVLGVLSLPFHLIMVLTAVVFAFHDQFYDAQEFSLAGPQITRTAPAAPAPDPSRVPLPPKQIVSALAEQAPGFTPTLLSYRQSRGSLGLRVQGTDSRYPLRGATFGVAVVDPYTGQVKSSDYLPGHQSGWFVTLTSFFALHFGNFGGATVRWGYFLLGLGGAFLFYTGNLLWIESRRKRERRGAMAAQSLSVRAMSNLTVGVSLGCVAGISFTIAAAKWLPQQNALSHWHHWCYYGIFLAAVIWASLRGAARASVELLCLAAVATLLIPISSLLGAFSGRAWNHADTVLVDWVALLAAATLGLIAWATHRRLANHPGSGPWSLVQDPATA